MALIKVQRDPARITNTEDSHYNGNFLDWLCQNETENFGDLHCLITLNSVVIADSSKMTGVELDKACDIEIGEFDQICIVLRPAGFDPITAAIIFVAIAVTSYVVARSLIPNVNQNALDNSTGNNQLNASSNSYRPNEAIPDIAGQVVSYPDFAQLSYYVYVDNRRQYTELFCVGVGYYEFGDWKTGESPLSDLPESTVEIFEPTEEIDGLINVRGAIGSENIDLTSPDQDGRIYELSGGTLSSPDTITGDFPLSWQVGDPISFVINYELSGSPLTFTVLFALITAVSVDGSFISVNVAVPDSDIGSASGTITNSSGSGAQWFTLDGDEITRVLFHVKAPTGIRKGDGETATVQFRLEAERLDEDGDPTGVSYVITRSFSGKTQIAKYETFEIGLAQGLTADSYRARAYRITDSLGDNALELIQLEKIDAVTPYTTDFGFVTMARVRRTTPATGGQSNSSSKINVLATRKLRIFNPDTGVYGATYVATRRFCDYAFYLLYERMGVPLEYIDTDKLYSIHDNLTNAQLGYFDYTFDDSNVAARDRLQACCNVARVTPWEDVMVWTFVRDQVRPVRSFMFNRRNLAGGNFQYLQNFRRPADYDSVSIKYVDPVKNVGQVISRKFDEDGVITEGVGVRAFEFELIGCRNLAQVTNRVELEVRRLIYQNITITDTALNDALLIAKGERTDYIDMFDGDMFDGEIIGVSGNIYSTSERFTPASGVEYWVYVTDVDGNSSNSVRAYPRADGNIFGFQATGLTGVYLPSGIQQLGSRYVIASNNDLDATQFIFDGRSRPNEKGECEITLVEYNELMYEMD